MFAFYDALIDGRLVMEYEKKAIYWDQIEIDFSGEYNEGYLAALRSELKKWEESGIRLYLIPCRFSGKADKSYQTCKSAAAQGFKTEIPADEAFERFTAAMVHAARRIKDCKNVLGFVLPNFVAEWADYAGLAKSLPDLEQFFMQAFQKKHSNYTFLKSDIS